MFLFLLVGRNLTAKTIRKLDAKYYSKFEGNYVPSSPSSNSITPPNPPSTPESFMDGDFHHNKTPAMDTVINGIITHVFSVYGLEL